MYSRNIIRLIFFFCLFVNGICYACDPLVINVNFHDPVNGCFYIVAGSSSLQINLHVTEGVPVTTWGAPGCETGLTYSTYGADEDDMHIYNVSMSSEGNLNFSVYASSEYDEVVVTGTVVAISVGGWSSVPPAEFGGCPRDCASTVLKWSKTDSYGNILKIWCRCVENIGHFSYEYTPYGGDTTVVGTCIYGGGVNAFNYRMTEDGSQFFDTSHRTRDPNNDGSAADEGTPYKYDWKNTFYNCFIGPSYYNNPLIQCREHPTSWEVPGDESECP